MPDQDGVSSDRPVLVTGAAGFIGYHVAKRLLDQGRSVVGVDNLNDYYDVGLKKARLARLTPSDRFAFERVDIAADDGIAGVFRRFAPRRIVHLAAQAGVRYSLENPRAYVESNVRGFLNILEGARRGEVEHLVFASSSSVYGADTRQPYSEHQSVEHPVSLYAATKRANELMAHSYAHLFGTPCTGLRFFTVYGPWGRPDMALFKFTNGILRDEPISVFNHGQMVRDFTFVDDVVEGVVRILERPPQANPAWDTENPDPATSYAPFRVYNIGNNQPVRLLEYIAALERSLGKKAKMNLLPLQPGDVLSTFADVSDLESATGFRPQTSIDDGIRAFVDWYRDYYRGAQ